MPFDVSENLFLTNRASTQRFGPYPIPDDKNIVRFNLARCTRATPTLWASGSTFVRITGTLFMAGEVHETFSPDIFSGGIGLDKNGEEAQWSTVGIGPLPLLCAVCGERFHPGIKAYEQSLLHSTISLRQGRSVPNGKTVNDYKLYITANDDAIFARTFHDPALTPSLLNNRTVSILIELVRGPDLVSEFALEVM